MIIKITSILICGLLSGCVVYPVNGYNYVDPTPNVDVYVPPIDVTPNIDVYVPPVNVGVYPSPIYRPPVVVAPPYRPYYNNRYYNRYYNRPIGPGPYPRPIGPRPYPRPYNRRYR